VKKARFVAEYIDTCCGYALQAFSSL